MQRKTVALPGLHDLDITDIQRLIDAPLFQRLRRIRQLGASSLVYLGANHSRFEHALGTYSLAHERAQRWLKDGYITKQEARDVALFGLLHDIGHGPYSHATEPLGLRDHNSNGVHVLEQLQPQIEECGGNMKRIRALFNRFDPLSCCISHCPLGTDKLSYLLLDSLRSTQTAGFRIGDTLNHAHYQQDELVVEQKVAAEIRQLYSAFVYMYTQVYFCKPTTIIQSFLQQIVWLAMQYSSQLTQERLLELTDDDLNVALLTSDPLVQQLFQRLCDRRWPRAAITFLPLGVTLSDRVAGKPSAFFRVPMETLRCFDRFRDRQESAAMEARIAELAGVPAHSVLIVPTPDPAALMPDDVTVYDSSHRIGTLYELFPAHHASLREDVASHAAVRICVFQEFREQLVRRANEIHEYLLAMVGCPA